MQTTANYSFKKPEDNENFDQQAHANWNMDQIDTQIKARETAITGHTTASMPHLFADGGVTYRWGLSVIDGIVSMVYEEAV